MVWRALTAGVFATALVGSAAIAADTPGRAASVALDLPDPAFPGWKPTLAIVPDDEMVAQAYPQAAATAHAGGRSIMDCRVDKLGILEACTLKVEDPPGYGFGATMLKLAGVFRGVPPHVDGRPVSGARITIGMDWRPPSADDTASRGSAPEGDVVSVTWKRIPNYQDFTQTYPANAYVKQLPGKVALRCKADASGHLKDCTVLTEEPRGYDFAKPALRIAKYYYQLSPTASDGKSVEGLLVDVAMGWHFEGPEIYASRTAVRPH